MSYRQFIINSILHCLTKICKNPVSLGNKKDIQILQNEEKTKMDRLQNHYSMVS